MSLSTPFIHRPVGTTLLTIAVAMAGALAYDFLPVSPLPQVDFPSIQVSAGLPGASPETMASAVATPLERQFGRIAGVAEMTSSSYLGATSITIVFDLNRNIDAAARDVQAAINAARGQLPSNLPNNPTYRKVNPADAPIMILAVTSNTYGKARMYDAASSILSQKLAQVQGVGQVFVGGGALPAVRVDVNPTMLNNLGLGLEDVRTALAAANTNRPKGQIANDETSWSLSTTDQLFKAKEYESLIIAYRHGSPVRLRDVAKLSDAVEDVRTAGFYAEAKPDVERAPGRPRPAAATQAPASHAATSQTVATAQGAGGAAATPGNVEVTPAILLVLFRQPGANIIDTVDRVKALKDQLQAEIPAAMRLSVVMDRTTTIRASVHDVEITLLISIGLVILVVFVFLRSVRSTLIPSAAVPISLIGTFGVMYLAGYSIDNLSLMAMTIATGFVVDDAIVVIENITRHLEAGMKPLPAALLGAQEIGFTVVSISVSLIAVFIPILLMGGIVGRLFREFAVTLSVAILVSMAISLTTTPMMCAILLKTHRRESHGWLYRANEAVFQWVLRRYESSLRWVLRHQFLTAMVTIATIVFTVYLYVAIPKGFFPQQDTGRLTGAIKADQDCSSSQMAEFLKQYAAIVAQDPAVENVIAFTGGGRGTLNNGTMFVALKPVAVRQISADMVLARLRGKTSGIAGANLYLQAVQDLRVGGRSSDAQYQFTLQGDNLDELNEWAPKILQKMRTLRGLVDVTSDQQNRGLQASLTIDRPTASRLGITPQAIDNTLYDAFGQRQVSTIYTQLNQYHVILETAPEFWQNPDGLKYLYVMGTLGKQIPLSAFTRYQPDTTPLAVNHSAQFPSITLSFNLTPGFALGDAVTEIDEANREIGLPASIHGKFAGTAQAYRDSLANEPILIAAALMAVYIVLGILYESYIHPITILSTLPSAGVGALLALMLCNTDLSVIALIGIILLIGIVKKNAIMMIDFALEAERRSHKSPRDAIFQACLLRFRPITMTTMAALLGGLPLALGTGTGAELRRPLGIAIVGGLIFSQMLTLYTTPVVYVYLDRFRLWCIRVLKGPEAQDQTLEVLPS